MTFAELLVLLTGSKSSTKADLLVNTTPKRSLDAALGTGRRARCALYCWSESTKKERSDRLESEAAISLSALFPEFEVDAEQALNVNRKGIKK